MGLWLLLYILDTFLSSPSVTQGAEVMSKSFLEARVGVVWSLLGVKAP